MQVDHGDHCNRNATDGHDDILYKIAQHDAVHSSQHRIEDSEKGKNDPIKMSDILRCDVKWHIRLNDLPRNKDFNELSQANKTVSQKPKTANKCKCNNDGMRC